MRAGGTLALSDSHVICNIPRQPGFLYPAQHVPEQDQGQSRVSRNSPPRNPKEEWKGLSKPATQMTVTGRSNPQYLEAACNLDPVALWNVTRLGTWSIIGLV
jgi:hypothetical protein